jgi:hypothetical protein
MQRDGFKCRICGNDKKQLQIHHIYYDPDYINPWDYPDDLLTTLCNECHEKESQVTISDISELFVKDLLLLCNCTLNQLAYHWTTRVYELEKEGYFQKEALKRSLLELISKS